MLPFWEGGEAAAEIGSYKSAVLTVLDSGDFKARNGETAVVYGSASERILLLGLGKKEKAGGETVRRAYSSASRFAQNKKIDRADFLFPQVHQIEKEELLRGLFEGIALTNYAFTEMKHDTLKEGPVVLFKEIGLIGLDGRDELSIRHFETILSSVFFVRDLVNRNADNKIALVREEAAAMTQRSKKLKLDIFDKHRLEKEKFGLILAVARGSSVDPCLIQLTYEGNPGSEERIVLVGKGISYDTGGLSLKPTDGMVTMKCDMAGAATVLGAVRAAADLGLKVNVTALAPMAENGMDANSYKLGDVYRSYSGRTVEINNTDAEGRLVLGDAIGYAVKNLKPACLIDVATLTGAIIVALGDDIPGYFATEEKLAKDLEHASKKTQEPIWRMPLVADYKEAYKSDIADTLNSGGREAGAIKAALFLQEFVGDVPWVHIDLAGPVFLNKPKHYNTTKATGYGVRLLVEFLQLRAGK